MTGADTVPVAAFTVTAVRALMLYALAEAQAGHVTTIRVEAEGPLFSVADDGRGHSLDRTVEGTPYLKFIYTHFDYPFESGRSAPIQLQGIGMSLLNALCSELTLTVRKPDETLRLQFRAGQILGADRTAAPPDGTGITISGRLDARFQGDAAPAGQLEAWLAGVLATCPSLTLFLNGRQLQSSSPDGA
jgi:DNA gyrase/topoisomerase IV subunit B